MIVGTLACEYKQLTRACEKKKLNIEEEKLVIATVFVVNVVVDVIGVVITLIVGASTRLYMMVSALLRRSVMTMEKN